MGPQNPTHHFAQFFQPSKPQKTYVQLLEQCTTFPQLQQIQASLTTSGLIKTHPFLNNKLIETLTTKFESFQNALQIVSNAHFLSCFPYNTLIRAYSLSPIPHSAIHLLVRMLQPGSPNPNSSSFTFALKACARAQACKATKAIHALAITYGYQSSDHVMNTALHAYTSCSDVAYARKLFDVVSVNGTIKWNAMISGYVQNGFLSEALDLFCRMWDLGIVPNEVTVIMVLSCCAQMSNLLLGKQIHGFVGKMRMQLEREINVGTALLGMYAKCGCMDPAKQVFDEMKRKDTGVWNALIGGYVSNGCFRKAIQLYNDLHVSGLRPDKPTLVITLNACAHLGALDVGKRIHLYMEERYPRIDAILGTSLIEMYSKCGCINIAREVFDKMMEKDTIAWTSMIGALASHGHAHDALQLFDLMRKCSHKPDSVTFVGVLSACRHAGFLEKGLGHFNSMKRDYGITPRVEHYGCMIDLYSRAGRLGEALELIGSMETDANPIIWRSFLSACRLDLNVELAEIAVDNLTRLRSGHCGDYVLLSNIYALKGRWEDARRVRSLMKEEEIKKKVAFSLIECPKRLEVGMHLGFGS